MSEIVFADTSCIERHTNPYVFAIPTSEFSNYNAKSDVTVITGDFGNGFENSTDARPARIGGVIYDGNPSGEREIHIIPGTYTYLVDSRNSAGTADNMLFRIIHNGEAINNIEDILKQSHSSDLTEASARIAIALLKDGTLVTIGTTGSAYDVAQQLLTVCPDVINAYLLDGGSAYCYNSIAGNCLDDKACVFGSPAMPPTIQGHDYKTGANWSARYLIVITDNAQNLPLDTDNAGNPVEFKTVSKKIFIPKSGIIQEQYSLGDFSNLDELNLNTYDIVSEILQNFDIFDDGPVDKFYVSTLPNVKFWEQVTNKDTANQYTVIQYVNDYTGYRFATDSQGRILGVGFTYYEDQVWYIDDKWQYFDIRGYDYSQGIQNNVYTGVWPGRDISPDSPEMKNRWLPNRLATAGHQGHYFYFDSACDHEIACSYGLTNLEDTPMNNYYNYENETPAAGECTSKTVITNLTLVPPMLVLPGNFRKIIYLYGDTPDLESCEGKNIIVWQPPDNEDCFSINGIPNIQTSEIIGPVVSNNNGIETGYLSNPAFIESLPNVLSRAQFCAGIDADDNGKVESSEPHDSDGAVLTIINPAEIDVEEPEEILEETPLSGPEFGTIWNEFVIFYSRYANYNFNEQIANVYSLQSENDSGSLVNINLNLLNLDSDTRGNNYYLAFPAGTVSGLYRVEFASQTHRHPVIFLVTDETTTKSTQTMAVSYGKEVN
ncbi:MAG: hypothetical protein V1672_03115 [Candidatus Diapherotrites archaeon]